MKQETMTTTSYYDELTLSLLEEDTGKLSITDGPSRRRGINRKLFLRDFRKYTHQSPTEEFPLLISRCPFCSSQLTNIQRVDREDFEFGDEDFNVGALEHCINCLYWRWHYVENNIYASRGVMCFYEYVSYLSKLQEFNDEFPEGCLEEIAQQMRRNAGLWHSINPSQLERLVADIFKVNYCPSEVIHVGKPDDGGVDVLFIDSSKNKWLIQVKRREKPSCTESVSTVRNLLGAMVLEDSNYGIVVSTADHFSYQSYKAIGKADKRGMTVRLIDRGKLNRMLDPVLPDRPWLRPIERSFPDFADYLAKKIPSGKQLKLFPFDDAA